MSLTQPSRLFVGFKKNGGNGQSDASGTKNVYSGCYYVQEIAGRDQSQKVSHGSRSTKKG